MKVAVTISIGPWKQEFYFGKTEAKWALAQGSVTILTIGIDFSVKV